MGKYLLILNDFYKNIDNIMMLKSFISYGLSIMLLSATLHVDLGHEHYDGYSICDIDCDDEKQSFYKITNVKNVSIRPID